MPASAKATTLDPSSTVHLPRLRPVDLQPTRHDGQPAMVLRDPLQLAERTVVVPQPLVPLLTLLDGRHQRDTLRLALGGRLGDRAGTELLDDLIRSLDEALLLDNARAASARRAELARYRAAPHRPTALAGAVYPAERAPLGRQLDALLAAAGTPDAAQPTSSSRPPVRALFSPHIDYARGGPTYARAWRQAADTARAAERVIVLATDHYGTGQPFTLTRQNYATPYGVLPTEVDVVDRLAEAIGRERAFEEELIHRVEHAVELVAVWLHHVRDGQPVPIVPVLCGSFARFIAEGRHPDGDPTVEAAVETLQAVASSRRTLIVASGDLAHVGPAFGGPPLDPRRRSQIEADDRALIEAAEQGDATALFDAVAEVSNRDNVCGLAPFYLTLRVTDGASGTLDAYETCPADASDTSLVSVCGLTLR